MKKVILAVCAAVFSFAVMTAVVDAEPLDFDKPVYEVETVATVAYTPALVTSVDRVSYTVRQTNFSEPANQVQRGTIANIDKVPIGYRRY